MPRAFQPPAGSDPTELMAAIEMYALGLAADPELDERVVGLAECVFWLAAIQKGLLFEQYTLPRPLGLAARVRARLAGMSGRDPAVSGTAG